MHYTDIVNYKPTLFFFLGIDMVHGNHPSIAKMRDYADFRATGFLGAIINTILERQKKKEKKKENIASLLETLSLFHCFLAI